MYAKDVQLLVLQHHPLCTNMAILVDDATSVCVRRLVEKKCDKRVCLVKTKLKSHMKLLMSITCPKSTYKLLKKMHGMVVVP